MNKICTSAPRMATGASHGPMHIPRDSQIGGQTFPQQGSPVRFRQLVQGTGMTSSHKLRFLLGLAALGLPAQETHCFCLGESPHTHRELEVCHKAFLGTVLGEGLSSPLSPANMRGTKRKPHRGEGDTCYCVPVWIWQPFGGRQVVVQLLSNHP